MSTSSTQTRWSWLAIFLPFIVPSAGWGTICFVTVLLWTGSLDEAWRAGLHGAATPALLMCAMTPIVAIMLVIEHFQSRSAKPVPTHLGPYRKPPKRCSECGRAVWPKGI